MALQVREVTDFDDIAVAQTLLLAEEFIQESGHPVTFDEDNALNYLANVTKSTEQALLLCFDGEVLCGGAIVARVYEWHKEPFGYLVKFYVTPAYRQTKAPPKIARECLRWFDLQGCVKSFATATAGIGRDSGFVRLMRKFGYEETGPTMER